MYKSQKGFTLVELVVVIVLLGILGVTALGKFQDLSSQAADATQDGIASELSSAAAINYGASVVGATSTAILTADCQAGAGVPGAALNALMASGQAPTTDLTYGFVASPGFAAEDTACVAAGDTFNCSITHARGSGGSATASIICTGP